MTSAQSGGVAGQGRGYCLMIGGVADVVERLIPIFAALAPCVDAPHVTALLAAELGVRQGWDRYVGIRGDMFGVERYGASAPARVQGTALGRLAATG